jgi:hypothetical protein
MTRVTAIALRESAKELKEWSSSHILSYLIFAKNGDSLNS